MAGKNPLIDGVDSQTQENIMNVLVVLRETIVTANGMEASGAREGVDLMFDAIWDAMDHLNKNHFRSKGGAV